MGLPMGLLEGSFVCHHGGRAPKQAIKQSTETPTSTMACMGRFPSFMGHFRSQWAVSLLHLTGPFSLLKGPGKHFWRTLVLQSVTFLTGHGEMATRRPAHNTPIHMDMVPFEREPYEKSMWIRVLWAGLRVAMWIALVGGKFHHGLENHWFSLKTAVHQRWAWYVKTLETRYDSYLSVWPNSSHRCVFPKKTSMKVVLNC